MDEKVMTFRICVIGDFDVGKTSLIIRYSENKFLETEEEREKINFDTKSKMITIDNHSVKLIACDTAGQERFTSLTCSYLRNAQGVIFVYDISKEESFNNISNWMQFVEVYAISAEKILVGNKSDLANQKQVDRILAENWAEQRGFKFLETSAKTGENVDLAFNEIAHAIYKKITASVDSDTRKKKTVDFNAPPRDRPDPSCKC